MTPIAGVNMVLPGKSRIAAPREIAVNQGFRSFTTAAWAHLLLDLRRPLRTYFVWLPAVILIGLTCSVANGAATSGRPNIVVILADDKCSQLTAERRFLREIHGFSWRMTGRWKMPDCGQFSAISWN
jgi:hypothetical protein